jgi:hypothetical protein
LICLTFFLARWKTKGPYKSRSCGIIEFSAQEVAALRDCDPAYVRLGSFGNIPACLLSRPVFSDADIAATTPPLGQLADRSVSAAAGGLAAVAAKARWWACYRAKIPKPRGAADAHRRVRLKIANAQWDNGTFSRRVVAAWVRNQLSFAHGALGFRLKARFAAQQQE